MAIHRGTDYRAGDIWEMPEDGRRYEVIDGELSVTPSPSWRHQRAVTQLMVRIGAYLMQQPIGQIATAPLSMILDDRTEVQPDLVYVSNERQHVIAPEGIRGAPDLVVEVLSASTAARDRSVKLVAYARAGIPHYWIVDTEARVVEEYRLPPDGYALAAQHRTSAVFEPVLFPGLEISVDEVLR